MTEKLPAPDRLCGGILIAAAILSLAVILHHPTLGGGDGSLAEEAVREAPLNSAVHGILIALVLAFHYGLSGMAARLTRLPAAIRLGSLALAAATITMTGAALVSGFLVPETVGRLIAMGRDADFPVLLAMLGSANQVLADFGVLAYGIAMVGLSVELVTKGGMNRAVGLLGIVSGLVFMGGILTGHIVLDVHGMTLVLAALCLWIIAAGVQLLRGKL